MKFCLITKKRIKTRTFHTSDYPSLPFPRLDWIIEFLLYLCDTENRLFIYFHVRFSSLLLLS